MLRTFRHKLLFWFLFFIGSNVLTMLLSLSYSRERETVAEIFRQVESAYTAFLQSLKVQTDFLTAEANQPDFLNTGQSPGLHQRDVLSHRVSETLAAADSADRSKQFDLQGAIADIRQAISHRDSIFLRIAVLLRERGFKDFGVEGRMRRSAHTLEQHPRISQVKVLSLRRHEKDYIIRNESSYIEKLNSLAQEFQREIALDRQMSQSQKNAIRGHLRSYLQSFNRMIELDRAIGIKDNGGLKQALNQQETALAAQFDALIARTEARKRALLARLQKTYLGLAALLVGLSLLLSFSIASRVTKPLRDLTIYITRFVDSNFSSEEESPVIRSDDEIGRLTQNFNVLKNEVIEKLRLFKEKVEERTAELAAANEKLVKVNEANSRFVPKEFLNFLGRESVLDVSLGDQVAQEMTVMFIDIRSFTEISETLTPQENFDFINSYLKTIVPIIRQHGGFVDKYVGDSVMALFPDDPGNAVRTAIACQEAIRAYDLPNSGTSYPFLSIGVGIHTGQLILGTIGEESRMETTVISDSVNVASRLEGLTKHYGAGVIVSGQLLERLSEEDSFNHRLLGLVQVQGKRKLVRIFEILDGKESADRALMIETRESFERAVAAYQNQDLKQAFLDFRGVAHRNPSDAATQLYLGRCSKFLSHGVPAEWNGIEKPAKKAAANEAI